jgi:biopolymer transport protein ExbB/TolQ
MNTSLTRGLIVATMAIFAALYMFFQNSVVRKNMERFQKQVDSIMQIQKPFR